MVTAEPAPRAPTQTSESARSLWSNAISQMTAAKSGDKTRQGARGVSVSQFLADKIRAGEFH